MSLRWIHATHALRPGLPFPAILQRRLGGPVLNLGFSGSACMERELADVFTDLKSVIREQLAR